MVKSTAVEIMRSFSKEDISRFGELAASPYFNKKSAVLKLYNLLKKNWPAFDEKKIAKEALWEKLYPGKQYNYGVMKNLIHDITKLAEEYIKLEVYPGDHFNGDAALIKALSGRNLVKLLATKFAAMEKKYSEGKYKESGQSALDYFSFLSEFHSMKAYTSMVITPDADSERDLVLASEYALYAGLLNVTRSIPNYISYRLGGAAYKYTNLAAEMIRKIDPRETNALLDSIKLKSPTAYALIKSYYLFSKAVLSEKDVKNYFEMKEFIFAEADSFSAEDLKILINCLTVGLSSTGIACAAVISLDKEILDLYDFQIERNSFTEDSGQMREPLFNKYVVHCCELGLPEKGENFIKTFSEKLDVGSRENCLSFANANLFFTRGDYSRSQKYLSLTQLTNFELKLSVKCLQAMVLYETHDYESYTYLFDSMQHFSYNNKEQFSVRMSNFREFAKALKYLFEVRLDTEHRRNAEHIEGLSGLKKEIVGSYPYKKLWLLRKIDELRGKEGKRDKISN